MLVAWCEKALRWSCASSFYYGDKLLSIPFYVGPAAQNPLTAR